MSTRRTNLLALTQRMSPFARGKYPIPEFIEAPTGLVWGQLEPPMSYGRIDGQSRTFDRPRQRRAEAGMFKPSALSGMQARAVPSGPTLAPRPPVVHDPNFGGFGAAKVSSEDVQAAVKTTGQIAEFLSNIFGGRRARREAEAAQQQAILLQQQAELQRQMQMQTASQGQASAVWPWVIGGTIVLAAAGFGTYFLVRRS